MTRFYERARNIVNEFILTGLWTWDFGLGTLAGASRAWESVHVNQRPKAKDLRKKNLSPNCSLLRYYVCTGSRPTLERLNIPVRRGRIECALPSLNPRR